jgi:putative membrane protein
MTLMMVLFWGFIAVAVVAVIRAFGGQDRNAATGGSTLRPEDVLAERFARGEIDIDEYRRRSDELTAHHRA